MLSVEPKALSLSPNSRENIKKDETAMPKIIKVKELSALKIICKDKLHTDDIKIIRGEARVLEMLEGNPNIV